jgi:hypothetical protein
MSRSPRFYDAVASRLRGVDLIVAEGIKSDSPSTEPIMRMYRQFSRGRGCEIVVQDIDYEHLGPPVLYPDLTGEELDERLRGQLPLTDRLLMRAAPPITGWAIRLLGPQALMNHYLGLEDLPTAEHERTAEAGQELDRRRSAAACLRHRTRPRSAIRPPLSRMADGAPGR